MSGNFVIKGDICHTPTKEHLVICENGYAVCRNGICEGVFEKIPEEFRGMEVIDCTGKLVIPGLADLHIHAPQYAFRGTGMDYELMEWLERRTFPEEVRYEDLCYARDAYRIFADKMRRSATTRALVFGTLHREATLLLMDLMEESGLKTYVGKVNMDRNSPPNLREPDPVQAAEDTEIWLREVKERDFRRTKPILTPRFVPACTDELMELLGEIRDRYDLPVQSHLSENPGEVEFVKELEPDAAFYADVYERYGLFGGKSRTVMAHCVYSTQPEIELMRRNGVWAAHCPSSNMNLSSGIAPVRRYLDLGIHVGLGSDVAAGTGESLFRAVTEAIQVSKMYWRYVDPEAKALTFPESFYLATKGGGSFFGSAGSFEKGYEFDALVLDESDEPSARPLSIRDRLERAFYLGLDKNGIAMKFAAGMKIDL